MNPHPHKQSPSGHATDTEIGRRRFRVLAGVSALRSVRNALMDLAQEMAKEPDKEAFLVLPDSTVTPERLRHEWRLAASVLRPELVERLGLLIAEGDHFVGIPRDLDSETQRVLSRLVATGGVQPSSREARGDASFVVLKILLHHWLTVGEPVTAGWLAAASGFSYPTIAGVIHGLGSLVERRSDRRLRLRWFSRDEFARLLAGSDRARATARFADRSGHSRAPESHVRRLEKLKPPGLAIGGVPGARHYFHDLDLVGSPRLDLSQHCPKRHLDLGFIAELDPALERVEDPLAPASVVVHAVRHADPLFTPRAGGLMWADPVECLLDLHEARLDVQAARMLEALQRNRPGLA